MDSPEVSNGIGADWERLKNLDWFKKEDPETKSLVFDEVLWNAIGDVRSQLRFVDPINTVYYPGALFDIPYPIASTDASNFIFVDPSYADVKTVDRLASIVRKMGGKSFSRSKVQADGEVYDQFKFTWGGRPRCISLYAQDAGQFLPISLKRQPAAALLLKNTYGQYSDLRAPEALKVMFSGLASSSSVISFSWVKGQEVAPFGFNLKMECSVSGDFPVELRLYQRGSHGPS